MGQLTVDQARLKRLLGSPELEWLVERIHRRLEQGAGLDATVTLTGATPAQRQAVHRLLGRAPRPGASLRVSLPAVDEVVRRSGVSPDGLAAAVIALRGPVIVRSEARARTESSWLEAFAPLEAAVSGRPELAQWYAELRRGGLVRRLAGYPESATPLLAELAAVISCLPASGQQLGRFAADVLGDPHALDDDRTLTTLVLGAARVLSGLTAGSGSSSAEQPARREVWAAVGLLRDELSTTVLTLGLPGDIHTATGRALGAWKDAGQPVQLTLRHLVRDPPRLPPVPIVFVCEGPIVVSEAADQLGAGAASAPLVCTSGQPRAAAMHLLRMLAGAGAELRYHGDFDWGGIRIANVLFRRLPVTPWQFDTASYRAAANDQCRALTGSPVDASWDAGLRPAMEHAGRRAEEELVLDRLIADLCP